jgi:hypothetical protein
MGKIFTQSALEAIAQALADTTDGLTGSEIGHILVSLKMADPTPAMTKWKRLHGLGAVVVAADLAALRKQLTVTSPRTIVLARSFWEARRSSRLFGS